MGDIRQERRAVAWGVFFPNPQATPIVFTKRLKAEKAFRELGESADRIEPLYDEAALRALVERVCEISGAHDCTKHSFGPADPCDCKGAIIAAIRTELGGD